MRASVRNCLLIASLELASPLRAGTSGVYLPPAPTGPGGEDAIETASGTRCRQSLNSSGPYLDLGVSGTSGTRDDPTQSFVYRDTRPNEATGYARITIPLGRRPTRIDCSRVYELELARLKREVELLKLGVR